MPCEYDIDDPDASADPDKVNFYLGDNEDPLPMDDDCSQGDEGWTWTDAEKNRIRFCEKTCDELKQGGYSEVSATFGCPTVVIQ